MTRRAAAICVVLLSQAAGARAEGLFDAETLAFAKKLDTTSLSLLGVQYAGRVAILDSFARDQLSRVYGRPSVDHAPPAFACLELYFNAGEYLRRPVLYVRETQMRRLLAQHLAGPAAALFDKTHRLMPAALLSRGAQHVLVVTGRAGPEDFPSADEFASLGGVLAALSDRPEFRLATDRLSAAVVAFLAVGDLKMLPTSDGRWLAIDGTLIGPPATRPATRLTTLAAAFAELRDAWRARDAGGVNRLIELLSDELPAQAETYPPLALRRAERLYNRTYKGTMVFVGFALALAVLVPAAASGRKGLRRVGLVLFGLSTLALLASFVLRWLLSGRAWYLPPIMNQFEGVVGSALLAAMVALGLEMVCKSNYIALAASLYATAALLCGLLLPGRMGASVGAAHGILSSPIMAAHVAVIIVAHGLVGMTFVISAAYLLVWFVSDRSGDAPISSPPDLTAPAAPGAPAVIDRCNLIVAQLACWTLAAGTMLGAYWADFAWARFWGWDRKETWALITTLIYVVIVHLRFVTPRRHRGLLTAALCVLGCLAMLFNWIVVNYFLAGKHSYA